MSQFKNAREVIQALLDGKKVRWFKWENNQYVRVTDRGIIDSSGVYYSVDFADPSEWEILEETPERWEWLIRHKSTGKMLISDDIQTEAEINGLYAESNWEIVKKLRGPF